MITLSHWFRWHADYPLGLCLAFVLIGQWVLFLGFRRMAIIRQDEMATKISEVASLAMTQKNRELLESILHLGFYQLSAYQLRLCEGDRVIVAYPQNKGSCDQEKNGWNLRQIELPAIGMPHFRLLFSLPSPLLSPYFVSLILVSLGFALASWGVLFRVRRHLLRDLIFPLSRFCDVPPKIKELRDLWRKRARWVEDRAKARATELLLLQNAQLAHDIRSPLSALNVGLEGMKDFPMDRLRLVQWATARIREMAEGLMKNPVSSSPPKRPSAKEESEPIQVRSLLKMVKERSAYLLPAEKAAIDLVLPSHEVKVKGDPRRLERVLLNLLKNSMESMRGEGRISITLDESDREGWIRISDTGLGIPSDVMAMLGKTPFTYGKKSGTGWGLYSANTTMKAMGGSFRIVSEEGQGTEVHLGLPKYLEPKT